MYCNFDLPPTLYSLNPPTEEAEKLVSRWIDSAESTTMTGVAARALALAGSSLGSPCVCGVSDSLNAVANIPSQCIEAFPGGREVIKNAVDIFAKAVRAVHAGGAFASLLAAEAFVRLIVALILAPFADFAIEADFLMRRMRDSGDGAGLAPDAEAYEKELPVIAESGPDFIPVLVCLGKAAAARARVPLVEKSIDELLAELEGGETGGGSGGKKSKASKKKKGGGAGKTAASSVTTVSAVPAPPVTKVALAAATSPDATPHLHPSAALEADHKSGVTPATGSTPTHTTEQHDGAAATGSGSQGPLPTVDASRPTLLQRAPVAPVPVSSKSTAVTKTTATGKQHATSPGPAFQADVTNTAVSTSTGTANKVAATLPVPVASKPAPPQKPAVTSSPASVANKSATGPQVAPRSTLAPGIAAAPTTQIAAAGLPKGGGRVTHVQSTLPVPARAAATGASRTDAPVAPSVPASAAGNPTATPIRAQSAAAPGTTAFAPGTPAAATGSRQPPQWQPSPVPLTPPVPPAAETQSQAGARASAASTIATSNPTPVSSSASDSPKLIVSHHESSPRAAAPEHLKSTADNSIAAPVDPSPLVSARTAVDKTVARPLPVDDAIAVDPGAADSSSGDLLSLAWPSGRGEDAPLRSTALSAAGGSGWGGIPDVGWGTIGGLLSAGHLGVGFSASGGARGSGLLGLQMQQLAPADGSATSSLLLPLSSDGHADDVVAKGAAIATVAGSAGLLASDAMAPGQTLPSHGHAHGPIIGEGSREASQVRSTGSNSEQERLAQVRGGLSGKCASV